MAFIKEEEIEEIRQKADIVDIISSYLKVTPKGKNFVALCPFHDDHSPSLMISREKQIFNCFTCRTGGNVFTFVMKYENVDFIEAVKIVADKIGYNLNISNNFNSKKNNPDYEIMNFATKYFINNLNSSAGIDAKKYLINRGITEDIIKEFNLGLALNEKNQLYQILNKKNYELNDLEELGLVGKNGLDVYDFFINRIIIPIRDENGQVVGFTGRIYHDEDTSKYVNTKETKIYKKSKILFNYHLAKKYIRDCKNVIIVEGNMDAIKLSSCGIKNVVALMGVAISKDQMEMLKKLRVPIILMLDNDQAGLDATVKLGQIMIDYGLDINVVRLNGAKDPDEYIRKFGVDALKDNIKNAKKYIDFKLEYLKNNYDLNNIEELVNYVNEVLKSVNNTDDLTKDIIITKISKDYQIDKQLLASRIINNKSENHDIVEKVHRKKTRYETAADLILYYMMNDNKYITIYKKKLGYFKNKIERIIAAEITYYNNEHQGIDIASFTNHIMLNEDIKDKCLEIISEYGNKELNDKEFLGCINVILDIYNKDEIKKIKNEIKNEMDINKKVELINKLTELKKRDDK